VIRDKGYLAQFSQFFSSRVLRELADRGHSKTISQTIKYAGLDIPNEGVSFRDLFELVYQLLLQNYRCEYVYINTIANKILLEKHGYPDSILRTQLNTQRRIADAVIFNGTSTVYEVKSELDSFDRLEGQLEEYKRLFGFVYVVSHPQAVSRLDDMLTEDVGLISLSPDCDLETVRQAQDNSTNINPSAIFDILRKSEYCSIISRELGFVPDVPNTRLYSECKKIFSTFEPEVAHSYMVEAYRARTSSFTLNLLELLPYSLKATCFRNRLSKKQWKNLSLSLDSHFVPV